MKTTTGETFTPFRYVKVDVSFEEKMKYVKLFLIKEYNFTLLYGREWVSVFNNFPLNLKYVYVNEIAHSFDKLKVLLNYFSDLFANKVEQIKDLTQNST